MWGGPSGQFDTWIGAPTERRAFLDLLEYVPNVVVISGDRHEFAAVEHLGANPIMEFSIRYDFAFRFGLWACTSDALFLLQAP